MKLYVPLYGSTEERQNDREISENRTREESLQRYIDRMQELILDRQLRESSVGDAVRDVSRARTLTVLRGLDGQRKGLLLRFLYEAELIGKASEEVDPIGEVIDLDGADLSYTILPSTYLSDVNLHNVNLIYANLQESYFWGAILTGANLTGANLIGANLHNAYLLSADLGGADLRDADLSGADLSGAENWTNEQLAKASSLTGAIMPDETEITEELWEAFKKQYRGIS